MPDIVVGEVMKIYQGEMHLICHDFYEDRSYRSKKPLSFMDDQAEFLIVGDIIEFVPHPDTPIKSGSLGRIRNRHVSNRFESYNTDYPNLNDANFEFKQYQYNALVKTNRPLYLIKNDDLDHVNWVKEGF